MEIFIINKIRITDKLSQQIIAEYPIERVGDDLKEDFFAEAWDHAVDNKLVDESNRSNYSMKFVDDNTSQYDR